MYDICCIGHITSDRVVTINGTKDMPGGTALYFSCAVSKLPIKYLLITSVGESEMHYVADLSEKAIEIQVQPGAHTVYFENIYAADQDNRTQKVLQKADPFSMEQVQHIEALIFHLGPLLADDFSPEFVQSLVGKGLISLDVQGYLRKVVDKKVYATEWTDKEQVLHCIDILKADVGELRALTGCSEVKEGVLLLANYGIKEIIITNGSRGSLIYADGLFYNIPAYTPQNVIDATGCGDTYMAGYLYCRVKGLTVQLSGEFAAAISGLKTAHSGPFSGTEEDVSSFLSNCRENG